MVLDVGLCCITSWPRYTRKGAWRIPRPSLKLLPLSVAVLLLVLANALLRRECLDKAYISRGGDSPAADDEGGKVDCAVNLVS